MISSTTFLALLLSKRKKGKRKYNLIYHRGEPNIKAEYNIRTKATAGAGQTT